MANTMIDPETLLTVYRYLYDFADCICTDIGEPTVCYAKTVLKEGIQILEKHVNQIKELKTRHNIDVLPMVHLYVTGKFIHYIVKQNRKSNTRTNDTDPLEGLRLPDELKDELEKAVKKLKLLAYIRLPIIVVYFFMLVFLSATSIGTILETILHDHTIASDLFEKLLSAVTDNPELLTPTYKTLIAAIGSLTAGLLLYLSTPKIVELIKHDLQVIQTEIKQLTQRKSVLIEGLKYLAESACQ